MRSVGRSACDHDDVDVMDEEDDDDEENEPTTTKSRNDTCLASHEFEWLGPTSVNTGEEFSGEKYIVSLDGKQIAPDLGERSNTRLTSPQGNQNYQYKRLGAFCPKQPPVTDNFSYRLSPSSCWSGHGYYHVSPVRSSWCCPSPPPAPLVPLCCHHGGAGISNAERITYSGEICEDSTCYPCCNYTSPVYQPSHAHDLHPFHHRTSPRSGGKESPAPRNSPETRPSSRRTRSSGSKRRDYSPLPYSGSSEPMSPQLLPLPPRNFVERHKGSLHKEFECNSQKILQLENDKKNLTLQVTVLTCQVEAQSEKISELETLLNEMKVKIRHTEYLLQQELSTRSAIENSKSLLMSDISNLKSKLTIAEKDRRASDEKCKKIESDVELLQSHLAQKETELVALRNNVYQNEATLITGNKCAETEDLRFALNSVMSSNEEKDRKIEDMKLSLTKCKTVQDYVLSEHSKRVSVQCVGDANFADMQEFDLSSSPVMESNKMFQKDNFHIKPQVPHTLVPVTSTPVETGASVLSWKESTLIQNGALSNGKFSPINSAYKSNSEENICAASSSKGSQTVSRYGTMPRQTSHQESQQYSEKSIHPETENRQATSKNMLSEEQSVADAMSSNPVEPSISAEKKETAPKQSHSARNKSSGVSFAQEEPVTIPAAETGNTSRTTTPSPIPSPLLIKSDKERNKGFLRFLNKWKRSGSQNLEKLEGSFKRGEMRATAGPRLGWSQDTSPQTSIPFSQWNTDLLVEWLNRMGLGMYISECKKWGCNGEKILKAKSHELEKELGLKNILHKKKLVLALKSMNSELTDLPVSINKLDYHWVIRWLDDVGLPQYKDSFADSRVDGRVLHYLTLGDLAYLKVTSHLHHISIKRGIQVLREKKFDSHSLIRRSTPDESKTYSPELVSLWTNHRVMEWLRTVDLSEYAPNLRGSGVHGALIIYEPKFNADVFASLLNIPPTKTLLRRHLATHFKLVVGDDLMQQKRDVETDVSYVPLTPNLKIKAARKGQFASKKKKGKKDDADCEEYVCPLDIQTKEPTYFKLENTKLIVRRNSDPVPQEQRGFGMQSSLHKDDLLKHSETTDV